VEFYIDENLMSNDTSAPYSWTWSKRSFLFYTLKVIAYDNVGLHTSTEINVWKFL